MQVQFEPVELTVAGILVCHAPPPPSNRRTANRNISAGRRAKSGMRSNRPARSIGVGSPPRSEEHTSELQSRQYLVCRLLLEKKNLVFINNTPSAFFLLTQKNTAPHFSDHIICDCRIKTVLIILIIIFFCPF